MTDAQGVLIGLIGAGIQASRSPALHQHEAAALGLPYLYRLIDLERLGAGPEALPDLLAAAERLGFDGLNITHPCKQAVIPLLDTLSPDAAAIGAVNTVVLREGRRTGHNTDWFGFAEGFRRGLPGATTSRVVQLGCGGAGAAVAHAMLTRGPTCLVLHDVTPDRAAALAARLSARFGADRVRVAAALEEEVAEADGLINATPIGMTGHPGLPVPAAWLRSELWVAEVVYFPLETALLRAARAAGCRTLDGGRMAVFQAVEAFRLFSGRPPDPDRMLRHFATMDPPPG